jgi:uncharacterized protein
MWAYFDSDRADTGFRWRSAFAAWLAVLIGLTGLAHAAEPLRITVVGGNGMIGQRIVNEALQRGHQVTVVVREPSRVTQRHERLKIEQGDALNANDVARLVAKRDVVISAVGAARASAPDYTLYLRAAQSLVTALRQAGPDAPRLVVVGGVGSLKDGSGQLVLERVPEDRRPEHLGQKTALDFYRTITDVRWTYVSPPGRIAPGVRTGKYRVGQDDLLMEGDQVSGISMEDYAVALLDEVENPKHVGKRFTVAN